MTSKKRLLVTMSSNIIANGVSTDEYTFIRNSYIQKLNELDFIPILVSGNMNKRIQNDLYAMCSAVFIPGGRDINPKLYGEKRHPKSQSSDELRDELEMKMIQKSLHDQKPFLGICRGAQALAVACGGTLHQYLPDETTEHHGHSDEELIGGTMTAHEVIIEPHTKAASIFENQRRIRIASKHNQAINNPGELVVSGHSPAGVAEIVEHPRMPFHIGIQGHPEVSHSVNPLFQAFSKAANSYLRQ